MWRLIAAMALVAGGAAAQQPQRAERTLIPAIEPKDGEAGIAAIVDRRSSGGCVIALGLNHRTGRTRDHVVASVEVFTSPQMSEVLTVVWQFADEGAIRWVETATRRQCQQRPTIVVRSIRMCGPLERGVLCEPELVPFRPAAYRALPWLEVSYRTGPARMTPEEIQRLPGPR